MVDWYSRDTKIINFNWEVFYAEPGYEGKINGHCNQQCKGFNGKGAEDWIVYCDDNNNDKLDEGEDFVDLSTKYDYDKAEVRTNNFKGFIKHCPEDTLQLDLHCGYKKTHVEEFLFEAEHYTSHEFFAAPTKTNGMAKLVLRHLWKMFFGNKVQSPVI